MIAMDADKSWTVLLMDGTVTGTGRTEKFLLKHFREVEVPPNWRDHFAMSRRRLNKVTLFESIATCPKSASGNLDIDGTFGLTYKIREILGMRTSEHMDAFICPSLYKSKMLSMPASLARYAITYYASSLVRYKPSVFDLQISPEQAYMFDAIARECALPMLIDTLAGLEGEDQFFFAAGAFRN
ncbi:hypothetical protein AAW14_33060 [Streptomyces hygroscopicus]|nr:hypothetical protein [Streptomyces hygroscopicus]